MKIFFWTDGFWPRIGGIETQALQFVECMLEKGYQFMVLAHKENISRKEDDLYQGIPIKRFPFDTILANRNLKMIRPLRDYLESVVKGFQPDIVHLNVCIGWGALLFLLLKKVLRMPIILTIHAPFFYENKITPFIEEIFSSVDQICCVSKWILREMDKHAPLARQKSRLIYNGLPMPNFDPLPLSFSPPTLLLLGRLAPEKGFDIGIQAFALLKTNAQLLIAGEGTERPFLEQLTESLGLMGSVKFIGELTREQVPSIINQATLVIIPSRFEAFGLVALEALQMGRPVIASNVGGLQEIISHSETGLLVPPVDPVALSQAIQMLLEQPEMAARMGAQGRKWAMENFTLNQNVIGYENLYRELAYTGAT